MKLQVLFTLPENVCKTGMQWSLCVLCALWSLSSTIVFAESAVYPPLPNRLYESQLYEVSIVQAGKEQDSYVLRSVNDVRPALREKSTWENHWTSFTLDGKTTVKIRLKNGTPGETAVRPVSRKIPYEVRDGAIFLTLDRPVNLMIDIQGREREPLFIFANPKEGPDQPVKETADTYYFGPGVHDVGELTMTKPNLYLAGGAYVKGVVRFDKKLEKAKIFGPGVLSGIANPRSEVYNMWTHPMIMQRSRFMDIEIRDIVVTDPSGANIVVSTTKLRADNVKVFGWLPCSDGISAGDHSTIRNCFFKTSDDNVHITNVGTRVYDSVHYLECCGSAFMMGWNRTRDTNDVYINGVDLIGDICTLCGPDYKEKDRNYNHAIVALCNMKGTTDGKGVHYYGLTVENVRSEIRNLIPVSLQIKSTLKLKRPDGTIASYTEGLGRVSGLVFRNFTMTKKPICRSVFNGNGENDGSISDITIENWLVEGVPVTGKNADDYILRLGKTSDFHIRYQLDEKSNRKAETK